MKIFTTALFIISSFLCHGQNIIELDPLSVTASRTAQKVSETGRSVTVIDSKLINELPVNSLDDLLKYAASVEMQQRGPAGAQADIVIRGGTFQQVLVLMDGIKINDPITGHFSAYMPIVPSQIQRIEILRGPAAAVYGSEAVGAVINIISKTFASFNKEKTTSGSADISAGEYGYISGSAAFHKTNKKINYSLAGQSSNATGQLLRGQNRGYFYNSIFSAIGGMEFKKNWKLFLQSSLDRRDFAAQNFYTVFVSDTAEETVSTWWNHAKLKHSSATTTDEIDIALKKTSDRFLYNPLSVANENHSGLLSVQYVHSKTVSARLLYNAGLLAEQKSIRSNDRGNHSNTHIAAFGSLVLKMKKLSVNPGLRMVYDKNYGAELLPQANFVYRIKKLFLKANVGRAIRSADFTERYNNYNKTIVTGGSIGNPGLQAENSWSYEAGADLLLNKIKISAAWFYRNQNDVIDWVTTPYADMPRKQNLVATGSYALAKNVKQVNTSGLETEISFSHRVKNNHRIYVNSSVTFLNSSSSDSVASFYIISHAKTLLQQTVLYSTKHLSMGLTGMYKQRTAQQAAAIKASTGRDYWLLNVKLAYRYKTCTAFVAVNNVCNVEYSDLLGSKMPRSWTTGGLSVSF